MKLFHNRTANALFVIYSNVCLHPKSKDAHRLFLYFSLRAVLALELGAVVAVQPTDFETILCALELYPRIKDSIGNSEETTKNTEE